jgi:putative GTP pyrophosphokinase
MTGVSEPPERPDAVSGAVADTYARRLTAWQLAAEILEAWLSAQCEALLDGADRARMLVAPSRIKDQRRTADKLRGKLTSGPATPATVEAEVRDLVGTKVLCKSTRDQRLLADRLRKHAPTNGITLLGEKDYVLEPKASGYRSIHMHFEVSVPGHAPVVVELQIKTRLQDSWGELTHEDLYKPGAPIKTSDFHNAVAATMANLLAEVDRLADHLAVELESTVIPDEDEELAGVAPEAETRMVRVRTTGPRYALAVDDDGVQGLIPVYAVRRLADTGGYVRVHEFVRKGDVLEATLVENSKGVYFIPVALAAGEEAVTG